MGVLPLVFKDGVTRKSLKLDGSETFDIKGIARTVLHRGWTSIASSSALMATKKPFKLLCRIDTLDEVDYYRHGGILHYVLRQLASNGTAH